MESLEKLIKNANDVYRLTSTIRFNNQQTIKQENVAEHSFMVSAIVEMFCSQHNIDHDTHFTALRYAILHDFPESETGDIIRSLKYGAGIKETIDKYEELIMEEKFKHVSDIYLSYSKKENILAHDIVKLADFISVDLYIERETMLGNQNPKLKEIKNECETLISETYSNIKKEMEKYANKK